MINKINSHLKFWISLINYLSRENTYDSNTAVNQPTSKYNNEEKAIDHLPHKYPPGISQRCKHCSRDKKRKASYYCKKCNVSLCIDECFMNYHLKFNDDKFLTISFESDFNLYT